MQHFVLNELSPDAGGFHSFFQMSPDAHNQLLVSLQPLFSVLLLVLYVGRARRTMHAIGTAVKQIYYFLTSFAQSSKVHFSAIVYIHTVT
jgi:hypothetical protein